MGRYVVVVLIAAGMSVVGMLLLEILGLPKLQTAGTNGRLSLFIYIAVISAALWLIAYHVKIRHGTRLSDKLGLAVSVPFVGTFVAAPFYGFFVFIWFWWLFVFISLLTVYLLALVAWQQSPKESAP